MSSATTATATATGAAPIAIELPEWAINLHNFRKRLFLQTVEPIIVSILGPVEQQEEQYQQPYSHGHHHYYHPYHEYHQADYSYPSPLSPISETTTTIADNSTPRRKLGFLPNYVEDVSAFRETSMSFATLTMLFTIMTCVLIVFLSCFYHNQKTSPLFISPRRNRLPRLVPPPLPVDGTFSWVSFTFVSFFGGIVHLIVVGRALF